MGAGDLWPDAVAIRACCPGAAPGFLDDRPAVGPTKWGRITLLYYNWERFQWVGRSTEWLGRGLPGLSLKPPLIDDDDDDDDERMNFNVA